MKRYNYLFENDNGPFFVYCETGVMDAMRTAFRITDESDGGELEAIGRFTDDEADELGFDTY